MSEVYGCVSWLACFLPPNLLSLLRMPIVSETLFVASLLPFEIGPSFKLGRWQPGVCRGTNGCLSKVYEGLWNTLGSCYSITRIGRACGCTVNLSGWNSKKVFLVLAYQIFGNRVLGSPSDAWSKCRVCEAQSPPTLTSTCSRGAADTVAKM